MSRHAIVTGASRGIGAAIALALESEGCRITALGRHGEALERLWGGREGVRWAVCDAVDREQVFAAVRDTEAAFGPADVLVNNVGAEASAPFHKATAADFRRLFEINVVSAVHATQAVLPAMRGLAAGRIVNVASIAGLRGYGYVSAYVASKHALVGLTRALAAELATTSITVNAVCPGFTDTDMVARSIDNITSKTGRSAEAALAELVRANPQGRLIRPEEVAAAVVWLCGAAACSVTGHCIPIDGGETA